VQSSLPHVLHIDANESDRIAFAKAMTASGVVAALHSLSSASNALLYLNQLGPFVGKPRPRLIFLDLNLPRVDGREFLEMMKANSRFREIAIAILMSTRNSTDSERCRALGVQTFLIKPATEQGYVEIIRSLL
jgi:two-component system response regulator